MRLKTFTLLGVLAFAVVILNLSAAGAAPSQAKGKGSDAATVYTAQCAKCHGADGKGIQSIGDIPNFTDATWQASKTDKQLSDGIGNGAGIMPGFKESLSSSQINALVKHVRSFGPKAAKKK